MHDEKSAISRLLSVQDWSDIEAMTHTVKDDSGASVTVPQTIDLYCWWAAIVGFRTAIPSQGGFPTTFAVIAEGDVLEFAESVKVQPGLRIEIPAAYLVGACAGDKPARFFTFVLGIPLKGSTRAWSGDVENQVMSGDVDEVALAAALRAVLVSKHLDRVQLGRPLGESLIDQAKPDDSPFRHEEGLPPSEKPSTAVVIGVIDDGASFAHAGVRKVGTQDTRVEVVWYQSRRVTSLARSIWQHPLECWYGAQMGQAEMAYAIEKSLSGGEINELACYASLRKKTEYRGGLRGRESHGAAVLSALGGSLNPANVMSNSADTEQTLRTIEMADAAYVAPIRSC